MNEQDLRFDIERVGNLKMVSVSHLPTGERCVAKGSASELMLRRHALRGLERMVEDHEESQRLGVLGV